MEKLKILVVDDEKNVLNIIKELLQDDYNITTETSSLKAAELIEQEKFDIYIIDYQMFSSELNGIELLEVIRDEYSKKEYMAILCTAAGTTYLFKQELH